MSHVTDLTKCRFGSLVVMSRDETATYPVKWLCRCDCGRVTSVFGSNLLRGRTKSCGCKRYRSQAYDLSGKRFGKLLVLGRAENKGSGRRVKARWTCVCDCGNRVVVEASNLVSGNTQSCGCNPKKKVNDISGKRFGCLLAERYVGSKIKLSGQLSSVWECKCDCGNVVHVMYSHLVSGHTMSCGCSRNSNGEKQVCSLLKELNVEFATEYMFSDLLSNAEAHLRFDFAVFKNHKLVGLIEVQGLQHYEPVLYFGGQNRFLNQQQNDSLKVRYCKTHNIPLLVLDFVHVEYPVNCKTIVDWLKSVFDEEII